MWKNIFNCDKLRNSWSYLRRSQTEVLVSHSKAKQSKRIQLNEIRKTKKSFWIWQDKPQVRVFERVTIICWSIERKKYTAHLIFTLEWNVKLKRSLRRREIALLMTFSFKRLLNATRQQKKLAKTFHWPQRWEIFCRKTFFDKFALTRNAQAVN